MASSRAGTPAPSACSATPPTEAIGRHISLVIPPDRIAEEDAIIASLKAGRRIEHFETERVRARRPADLRVAHDLADQGRRRATSWARPRSCATSRPPAAGRGRARRSSSRLVENSTDFIGMCDLEGVPFFVNRAGLEMVGLDEPRRRPARRRWRRSSSPRIRPRIMDEFFPSVLANGHGEIEIRFRHFKTGEARWMAYKVADAPRRRRAAGGVRDGQPGRDRAEAPGGRPADAGGGSVRGRPPQERVPGDAGARAAQPAGADQQRRAGAAARRRRRTGERSGRIEMLERQIGQLVRLVDDLLDMSRITRGKIELRKQRPRARARRRAGGGGGARAVRQPEPRAHGHAAAAARSTSTADPARLAQVVGNLLNNACKFTDRGGHVAAAVERRRTRRSSGCGTTASASPANSCRRLFEMFMQVDASLDRSQDGLGIGLTLVKTPGGAARRHVEARSEGLGRGQRVHGPPADARPRRRGRSAPAAVEAPAPQTPRRDPDRRRQRGRRGVAGDAAEGRRARDPPAHDGLAAIAAGRAPATRRGAAGHRSAADERLRGVPPHPAGAVGQGI